MIHKPQNKRNTYIPYQDVPYPLSRSKVELYIECPRCFYLDRRLGIRRPKQMPFNLNLAVDHLLKKEFDIYRQQKLPHPLMKNYDKDMLCFNHPHLESWRENFVGIKYHHEETNFILTGAVDDIWEKERKLVIVDYKATSSNYNLTFSGEKYDRYKRQLEFYAYLFMKNGFPVYEDGIFVACNGLKSKPSFEGKLYFDVKIIPHKLSLEWVEKTLYDIFDTLQQTSPPDSRSGCPYCEYRSL